MFLFIGLGNPGERYRRTRHNLGFRVVDRLSERLGAQMQKGAGSYRIAQTEIGAEPAILAEPLTYMNRSGIAVFDLVNRYDVPLSRTMVVCDDIHLPFGRLRIRSGGSDGGHNGLASVVRYLCDDAFPRLRMGIGTPAGGDVIQFVLSPFSREEKTLVEKMVDRSVDALIKIVEHGLEKAMSEYNR